MKEIELERSRNSNKADNNTPNGLETYVKSLRNKKPNNSNTVPKVNEPAIHCKQSSNAAATAFPQPAPCANTNCRVESTDEPKCTCTICAREYHLSCTSLKKQPAKSTKWVCMVCKDFDFLLKTLQTSVSNVQNHVKQLCNEQKSMRKVHESLRKENNDLNNKLHS